MRNALARISGHHWSANGLPLLCSMLLVSISQPGTLAAQRTTSLDSAGVTIVRDISNGTGPSTPWVVQAEPTLVIGQLEGPEEYLFQGVHAGTVLADGTTVVQNSLNGLFEIRYFDSDGVFLTSAGRWGQGPFEFHFVRGFHHLPGDSVMVVGSDHRFSVFGPRAEKVRSGRLASGAAISGRESLLLDRGHLVLIQGVGYRAGGGFQRSRELVCLHDLENETIDTLASLGSFVEFSEVGAGGVVFSYLYPFSPAAYKAAGGGRVWVGQSDQPEVRGFNGDGDLSIILRLERPPREVTSSDRRRFRERLLAPLDPASQRRTSNAVSRMGYPEQMPYFGHLKVDRKGNLWIQRYNPPWVAGDTHWDVYGPDASWISSVVIPEEVLPHCKPTSLCGDLLEIGDSYVLVSKKDSLGVPYVFRFPLLKNVPREPYPFGLIEEFSNVPIASLEVAVGGGVQAVAAHRQTSGSISWKGATAASKR